MDETNREMGRRPRKLYALASPTYLAAIALLLFNDFFLKQHYPGWFSGKLSDVAGLFAFSVFLLVILRTPWFLFGLAAGFAYWKSPFSQSIITCWNSATGIAITRAIDYTDLVALAVLPLAFVFYQKARRTEIAMQWCVASSIVSAFAFAATTSAPTAKQKAAFAAAVVEYDFVDSQPSYTFPFNRGELYNRIDRLGFRVSGSTHVLPRFGKHGAYIIPRPLPPLKTPQSGRAELFECVFDLDENSGRVTLLVTKLEVKRGSEPTTRAAAVQLFESRVVTPLRKGSVQVD